MQQLSSNNNIILQNGKTFLDIKIKSILFFFIVFFLLFTLARFALYFLNFSTFNGLSLSSIFSTFIEGAFYDFATMSIFVFPIFILILLPIKARIWLKTWVFVLCAEFILTATILTSNLIYFGYVKRHLGEELLSIVNDFDYIVGFALGEGLWMVLLLLIALIFLVRKINKWLNKQYSTIPQNSKYLQDFSDWKFYILSNLMLFMFIFLGNILNIPYIYSRVHTSAEANLALNGVFTSYKIIFGSNYMEGNRQDISKASDFASSYLIENNAIAPMPQKYPLMRQIKDESLEQKQYNLMIVLLESWVPKYIDGALLNKQEKYNVTPHFDQLIKEGVYFDNFYAFELRSLPGLTAVLTSVPSLPEIKKLGFGLDLNLTKLPQILTQKGYRTIFAQTSPRNSFRLDTTAKQLGFSEMYGKEDMPEIFPYAKSAGYGYDYDMFSLLSQKLSDEKSPFFVFAFTGTTHTPYLGDLEGFQKYKNDTEEHKYLNSLMYADKAIGDFIEKSKKETWFDNTIFIFVADHTFNRNGTIKEKYNIPFLIYAPKILKADRPKQIGSQLDILPTIFNLLNLRESYTSAGKNLFVKDKENRGAIVADGYTIGYITKDGALKHTRAHALETEEYSPNFNKTDTEYILLNLDKTFTTLILENRWYKNDKN